MVLIFQLGFVTLFEGFEEFLFGRALIMTGPEVGLKVVSLLIIEEALFVDD